MIKGQSNCYPHNSEHQVGKPLLPVLTTLVCGGQGSNPRPPAHETDALTNKPSQRSRRISKFCHLMKYYSLYLSIQRLETIKNMKVFENIVEKEENADQQFFIFHQRFSTILRTKITLYLHFICLLKMHSNRKNKGIIFYPCKSATQHKPSLGNCQSD